MPTTPHVIKVPEDLALPAGYQEVKIEKGRSAGRYAVMPDPRCAYCIPGKPGYMSVYVPEGKRSLVEGCSCVLSRLADFLRKERVSTAGKILSAPQASGGRPHHEVQLERIDEVLAVKQALIAEREATVERLLRDGEARVAEVDAQARALLDREAEMLEGAAMLRDLGMAIVDDACDMEREARRLQLESNDLIDRADAVEQEAKALDVDTVRLRIRSIELERDAAIDQVLRDGRYRRYKADVERLAERRVRIMARLVKPAEPPAEGPATPQVQP